MQLCDGCCLLACWHPGSSIIHLDLYKEEERRACEFLDLIRGPFENSGFIRHLAGDQSDAFYDSDAAHEQDGVQAYHE